MVEHASTQLTKSTRTRLRIAHYRGVRARWSMHIEGAKAVSL